MFADVDAGRLASVSCVLFESKTKDSYPLASDGLEEFVDDELCKSAALEVIHCNYLRDGRKKGESDKKREKGGIEGRRER